MSDNTLLTLSVYRVGQVFFVYELKHSVPEYAHGLAGKEIVNNGINTLTMLAGCTTDKSSNIEKFIGRNESMDDLILK